MSRTYKDRPSKLRFPEEDWDYKYYLIGNRKYIDYLQYPGVLTKKKKKVMSWICRYCGFYTKKQDK